MEKSLQGFALLFACCLLVECENATSTTKAYDLSGLPPQITVQLYPHQPEHSKLVPTEQAFEHLLELSETDRPYASIDKLQFYVGPSIDSSIVGNIRRFFDKVSRASGIPTSETNDEESANFVFLSSDYWKETSLTDAGRRSLGNNFSRFDRWSPYGCLLSWRAKDSTQHGAPSDADLVSAVAVILIDEDLASISETRLFDYGEFKYGYSVKCLGANIISALGLFGVPETYPSINSDPIRSASNFSYSEYDYAALVLRYRYQVKPKERVKRVSGFIQKD